MNLSEPAYFAEDDFGPRSPGLEQVYPTAAPSPSPPPLVNNKVYHPPVSPASSRRQKKANRRKHRPTQGDWVLIREMAPNQPEIAQQVSQQALNSDSCDSGPEEDEDMEEQSKNANSASVAPTASHVVQSGDQSFNMQQPFKDALDASGQPTATSTHRDSVLEADIRISSMSSDRRPSEAQGGSLPNGIRQNANDPNPAKLSVAFTVPSHTSQSSHRRDSTAIGPHDNAVQLQQLQIPQSDRLPALQPQSPMNDAASPNTQQRLPSISNMVGELPQRASHTPASPFPPLSALSASSPMSAGSDMPRGDIFLRSGSGQVFGADHRRPSQASENGRYPPSLQSGSPSEGYQNSDGPSPGTQQTPIENRPRLHSLDGALASTAIILPPPNGSGIQQIASHGAFRCEYPGCNAAPFQTQYLLNSHTNVHSQSRPHYCPVAGCPRSEGGKGFKRKNEMIRHGLVHQSPGYVCPFCPDREHKYPRPDNLQR
ncbi:hypothetical protein EK21DRAFT_65653 [Setomelanomma holmii]|uniref:C2H2-type domain-containing protein n=1 Tax=Setomelanomma holmii TaxID=210430 RepID=A0A9P4HC27_9PLEO|nr:hypothetical protein EK21DRAFT_65653 [Setomelanomma holmii]